MEYTKLMRWYQSMTPAGMAYSPGSLEAGMFQQGRARRSHSETSDQHCMGGDILRILLWWYSSLLGMPPCFQCRQHKKTQLGKAHPPMKWILLDSSFPGGLCSQSKAVLPIGHCNCMYRVHTL